MAVRNQGGQDAVAMADDMARLKALSDVAIDEVATPDAGVLTPDEAWTISAEPSKVRIGSGASANASINVPSLGSSPFPTKAQPAAPAQVDTGAIERLVSSRMDTIEDSMKAMEIRLLEMIPQLAQVVNAPEEADSEGGEDSSSSSESEDSTTTNDGDTVQSGSMEVSPDMDTSEKKMESLMELYEAQALALNPFLANPSGISEQMNERNSVGPHMLAALLLDNLTGMGAASFARKAISSKLLSDAEGTVLLSIVELAEPGDPDSALSDSLPNRSLMTFITLLESWRSSRQVNSEG
ncbi:MAG: hypothetical protein CMA34_00755 [Euryarchaeota archaeon]|nr:hypothetical protein [Euryarchaeota archaeon]|tara:strand:- start:268 stop:1155 length:888 start_codon:yes stop_codon:yes gene_type:complete